jgi:2-polyprenyl-3-methyl-5-hydroxy-6-metoxy-1,4-benzoquinol methylase
MAFYEDISNYYDYIFPTGKEQLDFICKAAGNPPKSLLDIACGTGGYSIELSRLGYDVTATDIDAAMIEALKNKLRDQGANIVCIKAGMLELADKLGQMYDLAFCIGNSIVHLNGRDEIVAFLETARGLLKTGGSLVIQIINFDRVLYKNIRELPVIKDDKIGLTFERFYRFDKDMNKIFFRTILTVSEMKIENEIPLYPLISDEILVMLKSAGFNNVKIFGDFGGSRFESYESFMLVLLAS